MGRISSELVAPPPLLGITQDSGLMARTSLASQERRYRSKSESLC